MTFPSRPEYEKFVYSLREIYSDNVSSSTLRLYTTSALTAILRGEIHLKNGLEIRVLEIINFKEQRLEGYSYAIYKEGVKIRWYDPQPHPENPDLAPTFPHHYHSEPNIKHNRQPAYGISFFAPNLTQLIADSIQLDA